jgi:NADPH:quinone reductase-like Zn-dependent oxidoreductase
MRAVFYRSYGSLDNLEVGELPEPKLGPDWVKVRVQASSVNPVDWKILTGRLDPLLYATFPVVPGWDLAGTVEAVGPAVTLVAPGDEVFGYARMDFVHVGLTERGYSFVTTAER